MELLNTLGTLGTFLVIAATAIAAIVQLRHMRGSNQITAFNQLQMITESPELQAARYFVRTELNEVLKDPVFRYQVSRKRILSPEHQQAWSKITHLGNSYEAMGALVKNRLVDKHLVLDMFFGQVITTWNTLSPITAIIRRDEGNGLWENFEYLTVLSREWDAAHKNGTYPAGMSRLEVQDDWLEADKQYAASLAPA
ncbi:MAG TPA: DUF4760 domain-containing protein [Candidatus Baltobacteraceae bacterium]|nr:DUF4760 domain-containing protein [Candidatus Baltobacteraceae bacterium]